MRSKEYFLTIPHDGRRDILFRVKEEILFDAQKVSYQLEHKILYGKIKELAYSNNDIVKCTNGTKRYCLSDVVLAT